MPINLGLRLIRKCKSSTFKSILFEDQKTWVAWWYCGIVKNHFNHSQPRAIVAFREWINGQVSDNVVRKTFPVTALGQMRIGSIWKGSESQSQIQFAVEEFDLDFSPTGWRFTSFQKAVKNGQPTPFPQSLYPLEFSTDKNWLIEFTLQNGGKLLVPCMEYFSRCYGLSQELKRILVTYKWQDTNAPDNRLYAPIDESAPDGRWKVKLRKKLVNQDVIFLAYAKYDEYTESAAKSIGAQTLAGFDDNSNAPIFLQAGPWFRGPAQLQVSGIWFDDGKSFLALQINGSSDPVGDPILRDRENSNKTENPAEEDTKTAWAGAGTRKLIKFPEIVDLTGDGDPDHSTQAIELMDDDFQVLGPGRAVIDLRTYQAGNTGGWKIDGLDADTFSGGEVHGDGKGIGHAQIHANVVMETHGALRDMWDALLHMQKKYPDTLHSVEWLTMTDEFSNAPEPLLIPLKPFTEQDDAIPTSVRNWVFLNPKEETIRGVMVARIMTPKKIVYIVEIQRRPRTTKDTEGNLQDAEESFCGLVFVLNNESDLMAWLESFLDLIRHTKGVVAKTTGHCPGIAEAFKHPKSKDDEIPCESAVTNAFSKVGIDIVRFSE